MARVMDEGLEAVTFTARPLADERGHGGRGHLMHTLRESVPTWSYHLDIYTGLHRHAHVGRDGWWNAQHVFTADGGTPDSVWQHYKVAHHYMPAAVHGPAIKRTPRPELLTLVGFVVQADAATTRNGSTAVNCSSGLRRTTAARTWLRHHPENGQRIHSGALNDLHGPPWSRWAIRTTLALRTRAIGVTAYTKRLGAAAC
jgi:hypothetical protein